jgi:hypothetical protein
MEQNIRKVCEREELSECALLEEKTKGAGRSFAS